ncbi:MAG: phosphodiester glycosidase family protein [Thermoleophilia bacterium]|nr:phosphodiester glycosidase family protein [Thermoleophilia bacterium]MDH4341183.1 phosphodiester glycosidase family protein [Thermoleophilia bacterium]MDH5281457.1 phosphodiester glycosidase family protein [Thermoleophilia bacterium]
MLRLLVASALAALAVAGVLSPAAAAETTQLLPGVTYETGVQFTPHGPVALHIVRGPRPVGLYRLQPVLSNDSVVLRETVSAMQRRLTTQATSVGVNGDFFSLADGRPSGILLRDGVLATPPNSSRSSTGITLDGLLDVRKVRFLGTWRGTGQRRALNFLNKAPGTNGMSLFTSDWGTATPRIAGSFAVTLAPFSAATPNADLLAPVTATSQNGRVALGPGTAVLVARGAAAAKLQAEAQPGTTITLRLILQPEWATVADAIGGGPVLVRDGAPVYRSNEAFTTSQLVPRGPRSAVGQRADGSVLLVTTDGRQPGYSVGMTNFELALALVRLGAVRGMALDGGGSSTLAFEGTVLNSPSDGKERAISTALMLQYYGVYAPPPTEAVVSPNGDGIAEVQSLSFKVVRPSTVTVTLTAPDRTVAAQESGGREPGTYEVAFPPIPPLPPPPPEGEPAPEPVEPLPPAEGRWTFTVTSIDDQGLSSTATQRFAVNSTLGFLRVSPSRLLLPPSGRNASIQWTQARVARVKVTVETTEGILVRTVVNQKLEPGQQTVSWNGRANWGKQVGGGRYVVKVTATNEFGAVTLSQPLSVRRIAKG